ncbi:MAG: tRNA (adenosine(37)-N6)-threonylcarbamoyltransferase complex dimerization subunit type 1 TsaB [Gammaproteobacteria bacterium RIFCSPHIGHO2_12_FULL_41_20]|nr:MAG: tRNA (adenosine(37)-N6)-threonylcarbamoyltransferase complex dimerization subunit type 1 TsaB [Gammaproteobacteria bacterium RIFCSPHIGHO2_12_FULL_41_20]
MNILGFDTSSEACSVALLIKDKIQVEHRIAPMQQTRLILPLIEQLLKNAPLLLSQLDAIAFGCGPGSFTGIRIASCIAQGLGFAANLPIIPVSSLAILAQTAYQQYGWQKLMVTVDARVGQVYWALYQVAQEDKLSVKNVVLLEKEQVCVPGDIVFPEGENWCGVGNGWPILQEESIKNRTNMLTMIDSTLLPHASALLSLARTSFHNGQTVSPIDALPVYLR